MIRQNKNTGSVVIVFCVFLFVIGCQSGKDFRSVNYGCLTKDGSKMALTDFHKDFAVQTSINTRDKYRIILNTKDGNIIWKDLDSSDQLVCGEDSSIISVSKTGAKWVEGETETTFSKPTENADTNFIGMTDKNTFVRERRGYSQKKMDMGRKTSSTKDYNSFPTFLVDKAGENSTKEFVLKDEDVPGLSKMEVFRYLFKENQIIFADSNKAFALNLTNGKVKPFGTRKDFLLERAKTDRFSEVDKTYQGEGPIEIFDLSSGEPELAFSFEKNVLKGRVEHIIDCCNYGLFLLFWGNNGNSLNVAKIDQKSGEIIWTSKDLLYRPENK